MFIDYVIFGIVDNGVMLAGALFGLQIENYFPSKLKRGTGVIIGAGLGNAFSDGLGGLASLNYSLALGSFLGCILALGVVPLVYWLKGKTL
jgi:ABC-type Fe3+-siderophore transport system permease subunit